MTYEEEYSSGREPTNWSKPKNRDNYETLQTWAELCPG
jgi:hypothetical protein